MESGLTLAILEAVPVPMVLIGRDERIAAANAPAQRLLGEGIVGRLYPTAFRQPALSDHIEAGLRHRRRGTGRHVILGATFETVYRVTVTPFGADGQNGVLCAFEDISEREQVGLLRRDFVANVSHELRSPLTALLGYIETLQGAARNDAAARDRFLGVMAREAGRMNRLVGDLLSLSRVQANERVRPTQRADIAALVRRVCDDLRDMAAANGSDLISSGAAEPAFLAMDADQITQVLTNLIENAVKYGGAGRRVSVTLSPIAHDPSLRRAAMRIDVTDQGAGIDTLHLPRLTERFYRVDSHRSREMGGTGLGLAIVKHIVNRHRGRLAIASVMGKGSTFSVILPLD